ncbi:MAG: hypothetical protein QOC64_2335 [Solirubrobacteraceae bacterium]|nr:hypothetical protein [Solirubrobacteraceae bacterium]
MPPASRFVGTVAVLAALALAGPAAAHAVVDVEHASVTATAADGVVAPGDAIDITETIRNRGAALGALSATLSSPVAQVTSASASYGAIAGGATGANAPAFRATLPTNVACGDGVPFSLALNGADGADTVSFEVPTGVAGPRRAYESESIPRAIPGSTVGNASVPDGGVHAAAAGDTTSTVLVTDQGPVKDIRVRIGSLTYPDVGKLRLTLVAPDNTTSAVLYDGTAAGANLTNTVFVVSGAAIAGSAAPHTGQFAAKDSLGVFAGVEAQGSWRLDVVTSAPAQTGELVSWGLDVDPAVCDATPVADLAVSRNPAAPNTDVTLDAGRSLSPVAESLTYEWNLDGTWTAPAADDRIRTKAFTTVGAHSVSVRVTDASGRVGTTTEVVTVTHLPTATLSASSLSVRSAEPVDLDSGSQDADGQVVRHQWDLDGNGSFERDTQATKTVTARFASPGTYTVKVRVTDNAGATGESQVVITVSTLTPVPRFTFLPAVAVVGSPVTLDASESVDLDGEILTYEWDLDGDAAFGGAQDAVTTSPTLQHTFAGGAAVAIRLRVTDDSGDAALGRATSDPVTITPNRRPVVVVGAAPDTVTAGDPVAFSAGGSSDPDGSIVKVEWDLDGDGSYELDTSRATAASRAYPNAGRVTVRVRVTDDKGTTGTGTVDLVVQAPAVTPPPAPAPPVGGFGGGAGDTGATPAAGTTGGAAGAAAASAASAGATSAAEAAAAAPTAAPGPANTRLVGSSIQRLRDALARGIRLRCVSDRPATCTVSATLSAADARRLKLAPKGARKRVVIGSGRVVAGAGASDVVVRLTARTASRLRRARRVVVIVTGTAVLGGRTVALQRAVILRR